MEHCIESMLTSSKKNKRINNCYDYENKKKYKKIFFSLQQNVKKDLFMRKYHSKHADHTLSRPEEKITLHSGIKSYLGKVCIQWNILSFLIKNLERDNIDDFFPIQTKVIPYLISSENCNHVRARDICVSAPTGSGKTLSYVIPVLNVLAERRITRLRALVVLPNRDIATQVYKVFRKYSQGSSLKIGLAVGQTDFELEKKALILGSSDIIDKESIKEEKSDLTVFFNDTGLRTLRCNLDFFNVLNCLHSTYDHVENIEKKFMTKDYTETVKCRSAVDILICTPGRLMDHLNQTPGFSLEHVRFLIIDEADRLLSQSYQNWFTRVEGSAGVMVKTTEEENMECFEKTHRILEPMVSFDKTSISIHPKTWRLENSSLNMSSTIFYPIHFRKILLSSTMTNNPQKLASLRLNNPKYFDLHNLDLQVNYSSIVQSRESSQNFSLPPSLDEFTIECTSKQKPLVLLALLRDQDLIEEEKGGNGIIIVFTSSIDSTHRLVRLTSLLWYASGFGSTASIAEFSSSLSHNDRINLIKKCNSHRLSICRSSRIKIVICSDGMSRGLDIPSVKCVINFDLPRTAKLYLHRCGRTARAGKNGKVITLLKRNQSVNFHKMRKNIKNFDNVGRIGIRKELIPDAILMYTECLKALSNVLRAERHNCLNPSLPLESKWIPRKN